MATIATRSVDVDKVKVRWEEPYVSAGLNRKMVGVLPKGRYRGYVVTPVAGETRLNVEVDATESDSVAVYEANSYSLTVRETVSFELDAASEFPLGADKTYYVILQVSYVTTGAQTTADIKLVDSADVVSTDLRLAKVDVLNGATNFDAATISQNVTDTDLPLATADKHGFFQPIPIAEPFYTSFSVTNKTSVQLIGDIYLGKVGADTQVVRNQYFGLLDSSGGAPLLGSDSKPIQIKGLYKEEAGTTEIIPNSADTDTDGYYTDPWVVFDLGEDTAESTDADYTGDLIVWAGRKRSISEFGVASFMIGASPSMAGPVATKTRRGLFPATVIAEPYKNAVTGLSAATYIDVTDEIYLGSGLAAEAKNKLCVLLDSNGGGSLLGSNSNPILVSDITKTDDAAITAPDLDADGFYAGPFRVVLDFTDSGAQVNYTGDCVVWYGRRESIPTLSTDQIIRSSGPSATGQIATGRQQGFLPAKYIAEPKRLAATADGGGLFCTLDGNPKVYIGTTDTDTQNIKELYFSLLDSNGFNVLLGSDQNRIGIDRITDDGGTELNPSTDNDGDGFYDGQVRVYFDFTDTSDTTYTSGLKVWAGEKSWISKLDVDVLLEGGGVGGSGAGTTTLNEAYSAGSTIAAVAGTPMSVNMTQNAADQKAIFATHNFDSNDGAAIEVTGSNPGTTSAALKVAGTVTHAVKAATGDVELDDGVVTLGEKSADPANVANKGKFYTKDVAGTTEYFYRDSAGTVTQVTSGGKVIAGILQVTGPVNLPIGAVTDGQHLRRVGTDIVGSDVITMTEGSDPAEVANKGSVYTKEVAGRAELFYRDDDSNIIQLTDNGSLPGGGGAGTLDEAYNGGEEITVDVDPVTLNRTQTADDQPALKANQEFDGNQGAAIEVVGTDTGIGVIDGEIQRGVNVSMQRNAAVADYWLAINSTGTMAKKENGTWSEVTHGLSSMSYFYDVKGFDDNDIWMCGARSTGFPCIAHFDGVSWSMDTAFDTLVVGMDNTHARFIVPVDSTEFYVVTEGTAAPNQDVVSVLKWTSGGGWSSKGGVSYGNELVGAAISDSKWYFYIACRRESHGVNGMAGFYATNFDVAPSWSLDGDFPVGGGDLGLGVIYDSSRTKFVLAVRNGSNIIEFNTGIPGTWSVESSHNPAPNQVTMPGHLYGTPLFTDGLGNHFFAFQESDGTTHGLLHSILPSPPTEENTTEVLYSGDAIANNNAMVSANSSGLLKYWNGATLADEPTGVSAVFNVVFGIKANIGVGKFEGVKSEFSDAEGSQATAFKVGANATHALDADSGVISLAVEASDPVEVLGKGSIYTKTAGGRSELFYRDDDANIIQLTTNGSSAGGSLDGAYNGGEEITVDVDPVTLNRTQASDDQQALKVNQDFNSSQGAAVEVVGTNTGEVADGELITGVKVTVPKKSAALAGEIWYAVGGTTIAKKDGTWSNVVHGLSLDHFNDVKGSATDNVWVVGQKTVSTTPRPFIAKYNGVSWAEDTTYEGTTNKEAILVLPISSTEVYVILFSTGGGQDLSVEMWNGASWSTKKASAGVSDPVFQAVKFGNSFGIADSGGIEYTSDITVGSPVWQDEVTNPHQIVGLTVDTNGNRIIRALRWWNGSEYVIQYQEAPAFTGASGWSAISDWVPGAGTEVTHRNSMWADDQGNIFQTVNTGSSFGHGLIYNIESTPLLSDTGENVKAWGVYGISETNIKMGLGVWKTGYLKAWNGSALSDEDTGVSVNYVQVWGFVGTAGSGKFEGYRAEFTDSSVNEAVAYRVGSGATHALKSDAGKVELEHDFDGVQGSVLDVNVVSAGSGVSNGEVVRASNSRLAKKAETTRHWFLATASDVYKKTDAGSWGSIGPLPNTPTGISHLHGSSYDNVWIVGNDPSNGYIAKWDGVSWTQNSSHPDTVAGRDIESVLVVSEDEIWTHTVHTGSEHNIYKSEDGGISWEQKDFGTNVASGASSIEKIGDIIAIATTQGVRYSIDGGENWATDTSLPGSTSARRRIFAHHKEGVFYAVGLTQGGVASDVLRVYRGVPGHWGNYIGEYFPSTSGTDLTFNGASRQNLWVSSEGRVFVLVSDSVVGNACIVHGLESRGISAIENSTSTTDGYSLWGWSVNEVTFYGDAGASDYLYTWNGSAFSTVVPGSTLYIGNWGVEVGSGSVVGHKVSFTGEDIQGDSIAYEVGVGASHALKALSGKIDLDVTQSEDDQSTVEVDHDFDSKRGAIVRLTSSVSGGGIIDGATNRASEATVEKKVLTERYRFIVSTAANDVKRKTSEAIFASIGPLPDDPDSLTDIHGSSEDNVWVVGADLSNGYIAKWDGSSWTRDTSHPRNSEAGTINSILVVSADEMWTYSQTAATTHYIHKWTSSGGWVEKQTNSNNAEYVGRTLEKVGNVIAISCNEVILYSEDYGETWTTDTTLATGHNPEKRCIFGNVVEGVFYAGECDEFGRGWDNLRIYRGTPGNWGTYINEYVGTSDQSFSNNISRDLWVSPDGKVFVLVLESPNHRFIYGLEEGGTVTVGDVDGSNAFTNLWGFSSKDVYWNSSGDTNVRYWNGARLDTEDVSNYYENGSWGMDVPVGSGTFGGHKVSFNGQEITNDAIAFEVGAGATHALKALSGDVELEDGVVILGEQSSAPATPTNKGVFYTKEVSGETEAFYLDTAGNEVQLTSGGSVSGGGGGGGGPGLLFADDTEFTETGGTAVTKKQFWIVLDSAAKPTSLKLVCSIWAIAGGSPEAEVSFAVTGGTTQTATETGSSEAVKKLTMSATPIATDTLLTVEVKLRISSGTGTAHLKYTDIYAVY